ncbi:hypothetical protein Scep_022543 [Stephania cephalantha]|uniref:Uncharacterized protein n=1 Tax=Stephania cephalantha TaxID=152367 RepID=A0AAP0FHZ2_9MAGN
MESEQHSGGEDRPAGGEQRPGGVKPATTKRRSCVKVDAATCRLWTTEADGGACCGRRRQTAELGCTGRGQWRRRRPSDVALTELDWEIFLWVC